MVTGSAWLCLLTAWQWACTRAKGTCPFCAERSPSCGPCWMSGGCCPSLPALRCPSLGLTASSCCSLLQANVVCVVYDVTKEATIEKVTAQLCTHCSQPVVPHAASLWSAASPHMVCHLWSPKDCPILPGCCTGLTLLAEVLEPFKSSNFLLKPLASDADSAYSKGIRHQCQVHPAHILLHQWHTHAF